MVQKNKEGLKFGTHQLLVCADGDNLFGENINIIMKTKPGLEAREKVGL
jgi:hypothetical protein